MSVSLPESAMKNVDFVKLALFLGDNYVLDQFNRSGNGYAQSALKRIESKVQNLEPEQIEGAFRQMKTHMEQLASASLANSRGFGKYFSINPKDGYIEFRSAGGLNYFKNIDKIQDTMLRYAYALAIASDPQAERQEYLKKLYQLFSATIKDEGETIKYFSKYVAGLITAGDLKSSIKNAQIMRSNEKQKTPAAAGQEKPTNDWEIVNTTAYPSGPVRVQYIRARNRDQAELQAIQWYSNLRGNGDITQLPSNLEVVPIYS
jgi:hypothetical protein